MELLAPTDRTLSRPFRIPDGPSASGPRVGGLAPRGLTELPVHPKAEYVLTVPLLADRSLWVSVFRNCAFEEFVNAMNGGPRRDDRILAHLHAGDLPRGDDPRFASVVSPHPIAFGEVRGDRVPNDAGELFRADGHKLGGEPYCIQEPDLPGSEELFANGYVHVLQVDFPSRRDGNVRGSWPFLDGIFNLFWKPPFHGVPYAWYLQK